MDQTTIINRLRDWIAEINQEMGWSGMVTEEGICGFGTPSGLEIFVEAMDGAVLLTVALANGNDNPSLLRTLLVANHRGMQTGSAALSISPLSGDITLNYQWSLPSEAAAGQFAAVLGGFTQIAEQLHQGLGDGSLQNWASGFKPQNDPGDMPPGMGLRV